jgi:hypothetical protein
MFWASTGPSSGAYQLQQQPLVYRSGSSAVGGFDWTDHDQQDCYHHVPTVNQRLLLQLIGS